MKSEEYEDAAIFLLFCSHGTRKCVPSRVGDEWVLSGEDTIHSGTRFTPTTAFCCCGHSLSEIWSIIWYTPVACKCKVYACKYIYLNEKTMNEWAVCRYHTLKGICAGTTLPGALLDLWTLEQTCFEEKCKMRQFHSSHASRILVVVWGCLNLCWSSGVSIDWWCCMPKNRLPLALSVAIGLIISDEQLTVPRMTFIS